VSLRILFADDSMTAQNMGKKILSEAGYDVVAVSNGAAAVKKIAEQKPDIIILDVYMPGYSGLEVCEKVRGSLDTLKTPVLLTVGKMEPYKSEDGHRVKADGVIIKPFEASDLLAIIKKFEERIGNEPPPPMVAQAVVAEPQYVEEAVVTAPEPAVEHHTSSGRPNSQPMVEVPDHMASSAAFGDMLSGEPSNSTGHFAVNTPAATFETSVIVPAPPMPTVDQEIELPTHEEAQPDPMVAAVRASVEDIPAPVETAPDFAATPVEAAPVAAPEPEPILVATPAPAVEPAHPQFIPVFNEPEQTPAPEYSFMPTATPAAEDLEIPREPALQETAEETTRSTKADQVEPGLMSTIGQQVEAFPTRAMEAAVQASQPVEASPAAVIAPQASYSAPVPVIEAPAEVTDADFEARVAAAMSAYSQASETHAPVPVSVIAGNAHAVATPDASEVQAIDPPAEKAFAAAVPIPSFEYQPPVRAVAEPAPSASVANASAVNTYEPTAPPIEVPATPSPNSLNIEPPVSEPTSNVESSASAESASAAASVEAAIPEAAAAVAAEACGEHHHTIAQAVHRVMERLKPELVEEIMKELKSKK
jgi:CheY-like chemotaxis protein